MKRGSILILITVALTSLAGCSSNVSDSKVQDNISSEVIETPAKKETEDVIRSILESADTTSLDTIVTSLVDSESLSVLNLQSAHVQEGYLNGFDSEIVGFTEGCVIMPMINTIPFAGYIFSTEDSDTLIKVLDESHNTAWNVCTVADSVFYGTIGDYVYYFMTPASINE